jgi:hypothetical protein
MKEILEAYIKEAKEAVKSIERRLEDEDLVEPVRQKLQKQLYGIYGELIAYKKLWGRLV